MPIEISTTSIERITLQRPFRYITQASGQTTIQHIAGDPEVSSRYYQTITDEQLLASLPEDRPAALLFGPDGSARLVFLR